MKIKEKSIEKQILMWFLILILVPLVILIIQGYHCSSQAIIETKNKQLLSILKWKKDNIEDQIKDIKNDLSLISIISLTKNEKTPACHKFGCTCSPLLHLYELKNCYKGIGIYDIEGKIKENSGEKTSSIIPENIKKELKYNPFVIVQDKENTLTIYTTSKDKITNKITGYIEAKIDLLKIFNNILHSTPQFGKSGDVFILYSKNKVARFDKKAKKLTIQHNEKILKTILKNKKNTIFEAKIKGKKKYTGYTKVKGLDVYIIVSVDKNETLKWVHILLIRSTLTALIVFLIVVFVAVKISKNISMPLKELERVSKEIINGNMNARIKQYQTKEAKAVGKAFNTMIDKLTEQSKELAQKSSLAAIGELSSSIVHEMRNPLSSVKLNINAVAEKLKNDKTYSELLNITRHQVLRLENMLSELLNFGKPIELRKTRIKPVELIKQALELVAPEISKLEQKTLIISEINEKTYILGDWEHLLRAISNIIKNAAESNPPEGRITIKIKEKNGKIVILIEDEGKGLSDAVKDMIFKPFFTTKENGTGLGLAIVKKIIEYHNGEITAENKKDGGAVFTITLEAKILEEKND